MISNFADRLLGAIRSKGNPCVVGLDPRIDLMPHFITESSATQAIDDRLRQSIVNFHELVIGLVASTVPAVKLQIAFYEQYGLPGIQALVETVALARSAGLVVIVDAKRNDIASTATAYANAFLGVVDMFGEKRPVFDADCITVSPFLGRDSLEPFVKACSDFGKGIFILVKTSNPGSRDVQDRTQSDGTTISTHIARLVDEMGKALRGQSGYSSIGAVVGATFPQDALALRRLMPDAIILVPGFGAQGGTAKDAAANFNADGEGAVVNASRSITYSFGERNVSQGLFESRVKSSVVQMATELATAIDERRR